MDERDAPAGHALYPNVYRPLQIGPVEVRNRLYLTPHGTMQPKPPDQGHGGYGMVVRDQNAMPLPHENLVRYYAARAPGLGLIIQGGITVNPQPVYNWSMLPVGAPAAFRPIVDVVHAAGTKIFAQLHLGNHPPSSIPWFEAAHETAFFGFPSTMTHDDIRALLGRVAIATRHAREAGYDGVELHAAHGYAAGLWLSPYYNRRTDEYGGSLENRLRLPIECLEAIRAEVGPDQAVGIRMNCFEMTPGGIDPEEASRIGAALDATGLVDFVDLDIGTNHSMHLVYSPHHLPALYEVPYIAAVRPSITRAVVLGCPGRYQQPADADRLLGEGSMDMVGGVRGWFADPQTALKSEQGRADEIRPCIGLSSCHFEGACVMNAAAYREWRFDLENVPQAELAKRVAIVGGGPAGLETARIAALRGHDVVLFEQADLLGGALNLQAKLPTREGVLRAADWWTARLADLGVDVRLGAAATADAVLAEEPDVAVVATGAVFDPMGITGLTGSPIPGWDLDFVYTPEQILTSERTFSGNVLIYEEDAGETASDIAWKLAEQGARIELTTRYTHVARRYTGLESGHRQHFIKRLYELDVRLTPDTHVREITPGRAVLYNLYTGSERTLEELEAVVIVGLRIPVTDLARELRGAVPELHVIGDASAPGRMAKATREGFELGWSLDAVRQPDVVVAAPS